MMHFLRSWTGIFCWTCIFLFAGCLINTKAATSFEKADSLYNAGAFAKAAIEYERIYFFEENVTVRWKTLLLKSNCYKQLGNYKEAENTLSRIDLSSLSDSTAYTIRHQQALCAYLSADFAMAESYLTQLFYFIPDSNLTYPSFLLFALTLNEQKKWPEAKDKLKSFISFANLNQLQKDSINYLIETWYNPHTFPKMKDPDKAVLMSSIIPGLGQAYAGYYWEGIVSAGLQVLSMAFTAGAVYLKYYVTAVLIGYSTFFRFYQGGQNRAEFLTKKYNYEKMREFNDPLKKSILSLMK